MNFTHYDLGGLEKGKTVEVVLNGNAANVFLMDHENMAKYVKAKPFKAIGGRMTFSPIRMQTIYEAHWHLVIDLPDGYGSVKSSYRFLKSAAANISLRPDIFRPTEAQINAVKSAAELEAKKPKSALDKEKKEPEKRLERIPPAQVTCPSCEALTMLGKFCMECGLLLQKACQSCESINPMQGKYCIECGTKM